MAAVAGNISGPGKRIKVPVKLNVEIANQQTEALVKEVSLLGPADVLGINESVIAKTEPAWSSTNFEPSLVPFVEFAEPDFLWRFSTRKSDDGKNWLPWLSLIILKTQTVNEEGEFSKLPNGNSDLPARILLSSKAILPDLTESWRWAHIHVNDLENKLGDQIKQTIRRTPQNAVCRLLSPRRLKPLTKYTAFIVPTYRIGLEAALGMDVETDRMRLSWETPQEAQSTTIPTYYSWEFQTDSKGDFEYLIRLLKPRVLTNLGTRTLDCSNPGYGLEQEQLQLEMEGALQSFDTEVQKWGMDDSSSHPNGTQKALTSLLNKREESVNGEKVLRVTPPVYGLWYAAEEQNDLQLNSSNKHWLEELNLDFRHRASAGLGVQFVKENQESLMQATWKQFGEINKVNRELNLARFGRQVSLCMHKRLGKMKPENLLRLSLPLQSKIKYTGGQTEETAAITLKAQLKSSPVSSNLVQVKAKKYLSKRSSPRAKSMLRTSFTPLQKTQLVSPGFKPHGLRSGTNIKSQINYKIQTTAEPSSQVLFNQMGGMAKQALDPQNTIEKRLVNRISKIRKWETSCLSYVKSGAAGSGTLRTLASNDPLRSVMWFPEFHRAMYRFLRDLSQEYILPGLENIPQNTVGVLKTNRRFVEAFMMGLNHEFASELRWREFPTDMRGSYFRKFWDTSIYSADQQEKILFRDSAMGKNLFAEVQTQFNDKFGTWPKIEATYTNGDPEDDEQKIAAAYERAIENWLLSREEEKDMERPARWGKNSRLGDHPIQNSGALKDSADQMVILIRGELLQKFGNTLIYLVERKTDNPATPNLENSAPRIFPVFEGALQPDITFIGFPRSESQVADYFIIFEERMTDLRYGLDVTDETDPVILGKMALQNLSWQHFPGLEEGQYLDGRQPLIEQKHWNNPAFIAKTFIQKQVRVAIELSTLIPQSF